MPIAVIAEEVVHVAGPSELKGKLSWDLNLTSWEKLTLSICVWICYCFSLVLVFQIDCLER